MPLAAYIDSVKTQTLTDQHPTEDDLHRAFDDLLIDKKMLLRLGPAINSGRGLFLFGAPGNGKTSIAERITTAFGAIRSGFPARSASTARSSGCSTPACTRKCRCRRTRACSINRKIDHRWVRIRRPTIVVGGELTMDQLEVTLNTSTDISEAPLQMKSNCGTLVIDDFGRQRMTTDELLNRWIVPLEKRYDFLNLANGKKIQVPFDQLIMFSTNLEPQRPGRRRVPAAYSLQDRSHRSRPKQAFRELLKIMARKLGVEYDEAAVDYLIETHYRAVEPPAALLPAARPAAADPQLLPLRPQAGEADARELRLRRRELLRGDVAGASRGASECDSSLDSSTALPVRPLEAEVERAAAGPCCGPARAPRTAGSAGCRGCAGTCWRTRRPRPQIS